MNATKYEKEVALGAKRMLQIIKDNPGILSGELYSRANAGGKSLDLLIKHKMVTKKCPLNESGKRPAMWYLK